MVNNQHSLEEVPDKIENKDKFWYVKSPGQDFPPVSIIREKECSSEFGIELRNINEREAVDIKFSKFPDKETFICSVESWLEIWKEEQKDEEVVEED